LGDEVNELLVGHGLGFGGMPLLNGSGEAAESQRTGGCKDAFHLNLPS